MEKYEEQLGRYEKIWERGYYREVGKMGSFKKNGYRLSGIRVKKCQFDLVVYKLLVIE